MYLTEPQLRFFKCFGFLQLPGLFRDEAEQIIEAFEQVWRDHGGGHHGKPHDDKRRSCLMPFADQSAYLSGLLDDPRIEQPVASILGEDFNYTTSDGNYYAGDTRWHSDRYPPVHRRVKVAFYLDPVDSNSGCLRVIPGSHRCGDQFADALDEVIPKTGSSRPKEGWGLEGSEVPAHPVESKPGDVLMFDSAIKHSSWGGSNRRRMFTFDFDLRYRPEDLDQLRQDIAALAHFWAIKPYGDAMIDTAGPKRMVHLEQRLANADHLPQLTAQAKQEMKEPTRGGAQWDE